MCSTDDIDTTAILLELVRTLRPEQVQWYNQPLVISLVSVLIGGFVLNWVFQRRAREETRRLKALDLLQDVAVHLNRYLAESFAITREDAFKNSNRIAELARLRKALSEPRLFLNVAELEGLIRPGDSNKMYSHLAFELRKTYDIIERIGMTPEEKRQSLADDIRTRCQQLEREWPLKNERRHAESEYYHPNDPLLRALHDWLQLLYNRATSFLRAALGREERRSISNVTFGAQKESGAARKGEEMNTTVPSPVVQQGAADDKPQRDPIDR